MTAILPAIPAVIFASSVAGESAPSSIRVRSDAELLADIVQQNIAAFEQLYDRFSVPVYSLLVRMLGAPEPAGRILQTSFWEVWTHARDYRASGGSPFTWIITIARRQAVERMRSDSQHLSHIVEAQTPPTRETFLTSVRSNSFVVSHDEIFSIRNSTASLAKLSPPARRVIELAFFDALTSPEIATVLSISERSVHDHLRLSLPACVER